LNFYNQSEALTEKRWEKIMTSIYWQTDHVMKNINFSRISVRNNHAITETLTLYLMGMLFPMMKGADTWKKKGKKWFEQEIDYQIEDDGTYIQDSMNYHRVVIQLLTYAIALSDNHGERFNEFVYEKALKSVNFLYQCQEPSNGWLPNYGPNDGSLFFPLSDMDYRDYRPQLDALHILLTGVSLFDDAYEDSQWIRLKERPQRKLKEKIMKQQGLIEFKKSGFYLVREIDTLSFIRCGLFKNNGSTDQLHLDVWYKGRNILMDGGSYMYNTDEATVRYFAGTETHNTVMIGDCDQMQKGMRFIWFYPPTLVSSNLYENEEEYIFKGEINAFKQITEGIIVQRVIKKKKGIPEWAVIDTVKGVPSSLIFRQLWHTDYETTFKSNGERRDTGGWTSDYYGVKRPISQIEFQTNGKSIETKINIE